MSSSGKPPYKKTKEVFLILESYNESYARGNYQYSKPSH